MFTNLDSSLKKLISGSATVMFLKLAATGAAFFSNLILARMLGAEQLGVYSFAVTIIVIIATIGRFGLENPVLRLVAASASENDWPKIKTIIRKSLSISIIFSGLIAITLFKSASFISIIVFQKPELTFPIRWLSLAVVPICVFTLQTQALRGIHKITNAVTISDVLPPLATLLGLFVLVPLYGLQGAIVAYVIATIFTLLVSLVRWRQLTPRIVSEAVHFKTMALLESGYPLLCATALSLVCTWSVTFLLGRWGSATDLGIFHISKRLATLTGFILVSVNTIVGPKYSEYFQQNDLQNVILTAQRSTKIMVFIAGPLLLLFLLAPKPILQFFGQDFIAGSMALQIMAIGQFFNVFTGSVSLLLMMSGHERELRVSFFWGAIVGVFLSILLIDHYGFIGAACATTGSIITVNIFSLYYVKKRMGFSPLFNPFR